MAEARRHEQRALKTIRHFFEHYKDLEPGKWVKVQGWVGAGQRATQEIIDGVASWKHCREVAAAAGSAAPRP